MAVPLSMEKGSGDQESNISDAFKKQKKSENMKERFSWM